MRKRPVSLSGGREREPAETRQASPRNWGMPPIGPDHGRWLEWTSRPGGRPLAVYLEEQQQLRACPAATANLRKTSLTLGSSGGHPIVHIGVDRVELVNGHLQAAIVIAPQRFRSIRVPLALLQCGRRDEIVRMRVSSKQRSRTELHFLLQSAGTVVPCKRRGETGQFRIETQSLYFLSSRYPVQFR